MKKILIVKSKGLNETADDMFKKIIFTTKISEVAQLMILPRAKSFTTELAIKKCDEEDAKLMLVFGEELANDLNIDIKANNGIVYNEDGYLIVASYGIDYIMNPNIPKKDVAYAKRHIWAAIKLLKTFIHNGPAEDVIVPTVKPMTELIIFPENAVEMFNKYKLTSDERTAFSVMKKFPFDKITIIKTKTS